jgi:DNA-binding LytR/AlgR family response regulator
MKNTLIFEIPLASLNDTYIHIGGRQEVNPQEVVMLQADINYTIVHFADGKKAIVATPLKTLESRFSAFDFYRTHKSFLVNIKCVERYLEATHTVQMSNNKKILVSRRKVNGLKKCLFIE